MIITRLPAGVIGFRRPILFSGCRLRCASPVRFALWRRHARNFACASTRIVVTWPVAETIGFDLPANRNEPIITGPAYAAFAARNEVAPKHERCAETAGRLS